MPDIKQHIPDGSLCCMYDKSISPQQDCHWEFKCIFLDRGGYFMENGGSGWTCRRHPDFELSIEHKEQEKRIHKCPPCLKENGK